MKILARAYYELSPEQRQRQSELGRKVIKREQLWLRGRMGRVNSSSTRNSYRRHRIYGYRISWGGWVLGSTAHRLAADQASTAVVAVLTPICVEKFLQNSDAQANLAALREISTNWQQGQYLEKGGWATRPGATSSDYELARACAAKLIEAKAASQ